MKTIGIIGGMGPLATVDLYSKIIAETGASSDRDNIHVIIDSNTEIPDRTQAIFEGSNAPLYEIVRSAIKLECMDADFLLIPCNTAHYFYDQMMPFVRIPTLHMIRETMSEMQRLGIKCAGLLATDGTCSTGVYDRVFQESNIKLLKPDPDGQKAVMNIIYDGIKAGKTSCDTTKLTAAMDRMTAQGAQTFILGCTELPLAFQMYRIERDCIDPTAILAAAAVRIAKGE